MAETMYDKESHFAQWLHVIIVSPEVVDKKLIDAQSCQGKDYASMLIIRSSYKSCRYARHKNSFGGGANSRLLQLLYEELFPCKKLFNSCGRRNGNILLCGRNPGSGSWDNIEIGDTELIAYLMGC